MFLPDLDYTWYSTERTCQIELMVLVFDEDIEESFTWDFASNEFDKGYCDIKLEDDLLSVTQEVNTITSADIKLTVIDSRYGEMLADRSGRALYLFDKERSDRPRCHRGCATAWPPLKTKKKPRVGKGLDSDLIGTTKRRNGSKQVTYDGKPLYFYIDDRKPGRVGCHDVRSFGGLWLVVSPDGEAVL